MGRPPGTATFAGSSTGSKQPGDRAGTTGMGRSSRCESAEVKLRPPIHDHVFRLDPGIASSRGHRAEQDDHHSGPTAKQDGTTT